MAVGPVRLKSPFLFLLLAIIVNSARRGWRAGIFGTALGAALAALFVINPDYSGVDWDDILPVGLFCAVGATVALVTDRLRQSQEALRSANAQLRLDISRRMRAEAALERRTERLELLARAARHLLTADDSRKMVRGLFDIVADHLQADAYFNFLVTEAGDALALESCAGIPDEAAATITRLDFGQAVCGTVALSREPLMATGIQSSDDPKVQLVRGYGIRAYACNPLLAGDRLMGTLSFGSRRRDAFDPDEMEFMQTVAHYVELAMQRVQLTRELRQANETLNAVIQNSALPIWAVDRNDFVTLWNPAAERVFGWRRDEVVGRPLPVFPEDAVEERRRVIARVFAGETIVGWEAPRSTRSGEILTTSNALAPLRDPAGGITGALAIVADITEQKRTEEQLRETQRLESIGVLTGGIAHDFNNLLVGILGGASLAAETTRDPLVKSMLEHVARAGERAADLTRQMLAYAGKGRFVTGRFDLAEVVRETLGLVQASVPKIVRLRVELDPRTPFVEGDRTQLQQVIMNLVLNAAEATEGRPDPTVSVASGVDQGEAFLVVSDNGCGMDEETRRKIFDPFFTTKFTGRGLGLAAVSGILRSHHGHIRVESTPGVGSRFTVLLPAVQGAPAEDAAPAAAPGPGSGTILLVDDEPAVQNFARACLQRYGYNVLSAMDGRDALRILEADGNGIALMILDLIMPVMGGAEVLRVARERYPSVRVILTSGHGETQARESFGEGWPGDFLQKPFRAPELAAKVQAALGQNGVRGQ